MDANTFEKDCKALLDWHEDDELPFAGERDNLTKSLTGKTMPDGFEHKMLRLVKMDTDGTCIWFRVLKAPWNKFYGIGFSEKDGVVNIGSFDEVEPVERKEIVWRKKCI